MAFNYHSAQSSTCAVQNATCGLCLFHSKHGAQLQVGISAFSSATWPPSEPLGNAPTKRCRENLQSGDLVQSSVVYLTGCAPCWQRLCISTVKRKVSLCRFLKFFLWTMQTHNPEQFVSMKHFSEGGSMLFTPKSQVDMLSLSRL